jgi:hypothetical protein
MTDGCFARPCIIDCTQVQTGKTPVCGTDRVTYDSICDLAWTMFCGGKRKDIFLQYYTRFALITFRHTSLLLCNKIHTPDSVLKTKGLSGGQEIPSIFWKLKVSCRLHCSRMVFSYSEPDQSRSRNSHLLPHYPVEDKIRNLA